MNKETIFSACRKYRYTLWRAWPVEDMLVGENSAETRAHKFVQFIGLNPSTADEIKDDNTIRRCIGYSKSWGYGAMCMTNLFGFRATNPADMMNNAGEAPHFSRENAQWIADVAQEAGLVVCAWGNHGAHLSRGRKVLAHLRVEMKLQPYHLGMTSAGHPKHPLYLKKDLKPIPFQ